MIVRTPVFVYAADPVSQAGLQQLLRSRPEMHVLDEEDIDVAEVAVVATEEVDDETVRTISGIQRNGCPRVIVVATRLDGAGVVAASDAGTLGMVRRQDATAEQLAHVVRAGRRRSRRASRPSSWASCSWPCGISGVAYCQGALAAPATLTVREQEVVRLLADGHDTAEIASSLCYSERTVKGVIHEVTSRLQLRNRSHVVAFALRNEMI